MSLFHEDEVRVVHQVVHATVDVPNDECNEKKPLLDASTNHDTCGQCHDHLPDSSSKPTAQSRSICRSTMTLSMMIFITAFSLYMHFSGHFRLLKAIAITVIDPTSDSNHHAKPSLIDLQYPSDQFDRPISSFRYPVTVVTAFYSTPRSKHSLEEYKQWISNFVSTNQVPMVIYTTPAYYPTLASLRYRTMFENVSVDAFNLETANCIERVNLTLRTNASLFDSRTHWMVNWSDPLDLPPIAPFAEKFRTIQNKIDPEGGRHNPHLYAVWNAKPFFVSNAAQANPFLSKYFFWMDIGLMRGPPNTNLTNWPNKTQVALTFGETGDDSSTFLPYDPTEHPHPSTSASLNNTQHKFLFVLVKDYLPETCEHLRGKDPATINNIWPYRRDTAEGGAFGGSRHAVTWFSNIYYKTMATWIGNTVFAGKDQTMFNALFYGYTSSFIVLDAYKSNCINCWFFFPQYFAMTGERSPHCTDSVLDHRQMVHQGTDICKTSRAEINRVM